MRVGDLPDSLQSMRINILTCMKCGGFKECTKPIPFYGNYKSPLVFVSRNPSKIDNDNGQPLFIKERTEGDKPNSGFIFRKILWHLGLTREDVYITNCMKCWTTIPEENRKPKEAECKICSALYLYKEIEIINPQLVVTFGKEALCSVLRIGFKNINITEFAGKLMKTEQYFVFPMMQPESILYSNKFAMLYKEHVEELKRIYNENKKEINKRTWKVM